MLEKTENISKMKKRRGKIEKNTGGKVKNKDR